MKIDRVHMSAQFQAGIEERITVLRQRHSFSTLAHRGAFVREQQVPSAGKTQHVCAQRPGCTLQTPGL